MTKQWDGIQDDETAVGDDDGVAMLVGQNFYTAGELGRRPGLTAITNLGGVGVGSFRSAVTGTWLLIATAAGNIEAVAL